MDTWDTVETLVSLYCTVMQNALKRLPSTPMRHSRNISFVITVQFIYNWLYSPNSFWKSMKFGQWIILLLPHIHLIQLPLQSPARKSQSTPIWPNVVPVLPPPLQAGIVTQRLTNQREYKSTQAPRSTPSTQTLGWWDKTKSSELMMKLQCMLSPWKTSTMLNCMMTLSLRIKCLWIKMRRYWVLERPSWKKYPGCWEGFSVKH